MNFKELFNPKTIAVVGANESEGFGGAVCKNLVSEIDDDSRVFYVNPKRDTLFGKKCYHNLKDVDSDIDLLIIAVNKKIVTNILKEGKGKAVQGIAKGRFRIETQGYFGAAPPGDHFLGQGVHAL